MEGFHPTARNNFCFIERSGCNMRHAENRHYFTNSTWDANKQRPTRCSKEIKIHIGATRVTYWTWNALKLTQNRFNPNLSNTNLLNACTHACPFCQPLTSYIFLTACQSRKMNCRSSSLIVSVAPLAKAHWTFLLLASVSLSPPTKIGVAVDPSGVLGTYLCQANYEMNRFRFHVTFTVVLEIIQPLSVNLFNLLNSQTDN